ncbi:hypothetical protein [Sphingobacterium lactis]|uniref:HTH cro/C1-type domain-containing protein n=1 Tax=Sphingobacterium lactis TaxID=797291 RepID=A0A1H5VJB7_9SPHI|nr:hypothetical protein [Sphingobacterium lactis]SEF87283.1 hypothetical protein SAMN05421877_103148 [Sphingobacterium lactis]
MTNIKERVLLIAEAKGIQKVDFFKGLELSYANFKGVQKNSALGSDAIATILSNYPDVNPEWLVIGIGEMFKSEHGEFDGVAITLPSKIDSHVESRTIYTALEKVINAQQATIQSQEITISALTDRIDLLEKKKSKKKKR